MYLLYFRVLLVVELNLWSLSWQRRAHEGEGLPSEEQECGQTGWNPSCVDTMLDSVSKMEWVDPLNLNIISFLNFKYCLDANGTKTPWSHSLWSTLFQLVSYFTHVIRCEDKSDWMFFWSVRAVALWLLPDTDSMLYLLQGTEIPAELCHGIQGTLNLDDDPILPDK